MASYLKLVVVTMLAFLLLDMIWLGLVAKELYIKNYGTWMRIENGQVVPIWWAALMVYVLFTLAILIYVLPLAHNSLAWAFGYGACMGFIIYGIYDLTCLSIFKDWPVPIAFIDWMWGTTLCAIAATFSCFVARYL